VSQDLLVAQNLWEILDPSLARHPLLVQDHSERLGLLQALLLEQEQLLEQDHSERLAAVQALLLEQEQLLEQVHSERLAVVQALLLEQDPLLEQWDLMAAQDRQVVHCQSMALVRLANQ
jgi:hypothetical protein